MDRNKKIIIFKIVITNAIHFLCVNYPDPRNEFNIVLAFPRFLTNKKYLKSFSKNITDKQGLWNHYYLFLSNSPFQVSGNPNFRTIHRNHI